MGYQPPLLYLLLVGGQTHPQPAPLRLTCEHQRNKQAHPASASITKSDGWYSRNMLWVVHLLVWWCILKLACFSKICLPARRNIFNGNSCLVLLSMRFPASWQLLIGLPVFGFCFDYVRSTSTYLLSDLFYRLRLRAILSKLASWRAPWRNWTLCSGRSSTSSWIAHPCLHKNYPAQVA